MLTSVRHYATEALQLDDFWFLKSDQSLPDVLPLPSKALKGASVVPWRYNLNTGTVHYSTISF